MYDIFNKKINKKPIITHNSIEVIKRSYNKEISKIINFFNNSLYRVNNKHILSKIINTSTISNEYGIFKYLDHIDAKAPYVGKHYKLTSEIEYGSFHESFYYKDIILNVNDTFNINKSYKNWTKIKAVNVLLHPVSNFKLVIRKNKYTDTAKDLSLMSVNIPLLMVQYKGYIESELESKSINNFIQIFVLPNMLHQHLNIAMVNRCMNMFYGAPMSDDTFNYPFYVTNYSDKIDKIINIIHDRLSNKRVDYVDMLNSLPSLTNETILNSLQMPDSVRNKQIWWALLSSRLKIMRYIVELGGGNSITKNKHHIERIRVILKKASNDKLLKAFDSTDIDISDHVYFFKQL